MFRSSWPPTPVTWVHLPGGPARAGPAQASAPRSAAAAARCILRVMGPCQPNRTGAQWPRTRVTWIRTGTSYACAKVSGVMPMRAM